MVVFEVVMNETKETRYPLWTLNWLSQEKVKPNRIRKMDSWGWSSEFIPKNTSRVQLQTSKKAFFWNNKTFNWIRTGFQLIN